MTRTIHNNRIREAHNQEKISSSKDIAELMHKVYRHNNIEQEAFYIIGLDAQNKIKVIELHTLGSDNKAYPIVKEICRTLILTGSSCAIACHNHPSGTVSPSSEDKTFTKTLQQALDILDIKLLDHIILSLIPKNEYAFYSFADQGTL